MKKSLTAVALLQFVSLIQATSSFALVTNEVTCIIPSGPSYNRVPNCYVCAPGVAESNVQSVDRALSELAQGALKGDERFQALFEQTAKLSNEARLQAYVGMTGAESDSALAQTIIGARSGQIDPKNVQAVAAKTGLSREAAQAVLEKVAIALMGPRR